MAKSKVATRSGYSNGNGVTWSLDYAIQRTLARGFKAVVFTPLEHLDTVDFFDGEGWVRCIGRHLPTAVVAAMLQGRVMRACGGGCDAS